MSPTEFDALVEDIRANDLREAIWTHDGQIIDGRNRYNACSQIGIEPRFREWNGEGSLVSFVVSLNLKRRHLNESQRAMVAQRLSTFKFGQNQHTSVEGTQICEPVSQSDAAKLLNVSPRIVSSAKKVADKGVPELIEKVESGEISVSAAADLAEMPKYRQKRMIRQGRKVTKKVVSKIHETALVKATKGGRVCVVCTPGVADTDQNFLAAVQLLGKQFPGHQRYLTDVIEELGQNELGEETTAAVERVLNAIRNGNSEHNDCRNAANVTRDQFDIVIMHLIDYSRIRVLHQGGKHDQARGARKKIYEIIKHEIPDPAFDDDDEDEPYYEPFDEI